MKSDQEMKCPFCDETYGAYLMYRHFAVAHCNKIEEVIKLMQNLNKKVVYVSEFNSCCEANKGHTNYYSQDQLIKNKAVSARIYLVDESEFDKARGDDWDDAPSCCNSEPPSERDLKTLSFIDVKLGDPLV